MSREIKKLNAVCEVLSLEPRSYSGRGMYGKECYAIAFEDHKEVAKFFYYLGMEDAEDEGLEPLVDNSRTDSLGRGIILYFPSTPAPKD